jgi:hypothetical protein
MSKMPKGRMKKKKNWTLELEDSSAAAGQKHMVIP